MSYTSKKLKTSLFIGLLTLMFSSSVVRAEDTYGTGDIAANRAAEQRAALAKKAERRKKEAEAKKQAEAQQQGDSQNEPEAPKKEPAASD